MSPPSTSSPDASGSAPRLSNTNKAVIALLNSGEQDLVNIAKLVGIPVQEVERIELADDNSFVNRRYWRQLLPELKKRRVKWFAETDLSIHEDDELLRLMRDSGCAEVLIGFESPVLLGLEGLELKSDWKVKRWPQYIDAVHRIQSHGIRVNGCFILGLDGQGPEIFDAVFEFAEESELYDVQVTYQTPFPGTPLYRQLEAEGRLTHPGLWDRCTLFDVNFEPTGMTRDGLIDGFRSLVARLYTPEAVRARRAKYHAIRRAG